MHILAFVLLHYKPLTSLFFLQICALISEVGIMECCDVRLIWANQESHDGHQEGDRGPKLKFRFQTPLCWNISEKT